jgi:thiol-disulfide isomerase/thioredoxin
MQSFAIYPKYKLYTKDMQKKILVFGIIMILVVGGGIFYLSNNSDDMVVRQETVNNVAPAPNETTTPATQDTSTAQPGTYVDYSPTVIANTMGTKILFFHAPWCPQCRDLEASIKSGGVPAGVTIIKVDYDTSQSLRQKYGVTLQTTVVRVDDQGNLVKKFVAYDDPSLTAVKNNLLQ